MRAHRHTATQTHTHTHTHILAHTRVHNLHKSICVRARTRQMPPMCTSPTKQNSLPLVNSSANPLHENPKLDGRTHSCTQGEIRSLHGLASAVLGKVQQEVDATEQRS